MEVIVAPEPMDYEIRGMYRFATLREGSGLAEAVRDQWPENPRLLMIAAEPENDTYTENLAMDLATALVKADLPVGELRVLQRETADVAAQLIAGADAGRWRGGGRRCAARDLLRRAGHAALA